MYFIISGSDHIMIRLLRSKNSIKASFRVVGADKIKASALSIYDDAPISCLVDGTYLLGSHILEGEGKSLGVVV